MSLKASNKYLFNQKVECKDCKHIIFESHIFTCSLNPINYSIHFSYRPIDIVRYHKLSDNITKHCGPLGKYYESK